MPHIPRKSNKREGGGVLISLISEIDALGKNKDQDLRHSVGINVTGPPGALLFDVKPEIALK